MSDLSRLFMTLIGTQNPASPGLLRLAVPHLNDRALTQVARSQTDLPIDIAGTIMTRLAGTPGASHLLRKPDFPNVTALRFGQVHAATRARDLPYFAWTDRTLLSAITARVLALPPDPYTLRNLLDMLGNPELIAADAVKLVGHLNTLGALVDPDASKDLVITLERLAQLRPRLVSRCIALLTLPRPLASLVAAGTQITSYAWHHLTRIMTNAPSRRSPAGMPVQARALSGCLAADLAVAVLARDDAPERARHAADTYLQRVAAVTSEVDLDPILGCGSRDLPYTLGPAVCEHLLARPDMPSEHVAYLADDLPGDAVIRLWRTARPAARQELVFTLRDSPFALRRRCVLLHDVDPAALEELLVNGADADGRPNLGVLAAQQDDLEDRQAMSDVMALLGRDTVAALPWPRALILLEQSEHVAGLVADILAGIGARHGAPDILNWLLPDYRGTVGDLPDVVNAIAADRAAAAPAVG